MPTSPPSSPPRDRSARTTDGDRRRRRRRWRRRRWWWWWWRRWRAEKTAKARVDRRHRGQNGSVAAGPTHEPAHAVSALGGLARVGAAPAPARAALGCGPAAVRTRAGQTSRPPSVASRVGSGRPSRAALRRAARWPGDAQRSGTGTHERAGFAGRPGTAGLLRTARVWPSAVRPPLHNWSATAGPDFKGWDSKPCANGAQPFTASGPSPAGERRVLRQSRTGTAGSEGSEWEPTPRAYGPRRPRTAKAQPDTDRPDSALQQSWGHGGAREHHRRLRARGAGCWAAEVPGHARGQQRVRVE